MLDLHRILYPTDFSDCAEVALRDALDLAVRTGATLEALHVLPGPSEYDGNASSQEATIHLREAVNRQLGKLSAEERDGLSLEYSVAAGRHPGPAAVIHAEERRADLIVLGTHGRRGLRHLLLGSVAEEVIRAAPCSVLAVRCDEEQHPSRRNHLLVPIDFSESAREALREAKRVAAHYDASMTLLFVAEEHLVPTFSDTGIPAFSLVQPDPEMVEQAGDALRRFDADTPGPEAPTTYEVRRGQPHEEIVEFAHVQQADLIVMARRGLTGEDHPRFL
ncbi:MAG: universal stress protein, partial [Bacteroidetes bacterium]|nr:universal stress protein [Bacteroidota bacterium]